MNKVLFDDDYQEFEKILKVLIRNSKYKNLTLKSYFYEGKLLKIPIKILKNIFDLYTNLMFNMNAIHLFFVIT